MIDKEVFVEVIEDAMKSDDYQNWINKQLRANGAEGYLFHPTCVDSVIKLLHTFFGDADLDDTISYFCFELDYGRKWKEGMIMGQNGEDINLSSPELLYDYLISKNKRGDYNK